MAHLIWKYFFIYRIVPLGVPYNLQFGELKSDYKKGFKSAYDIGVVQHHVWLSIQDDNTVKIKLLRSIIIPGHRGQLDEKNRL